MKFLALLAALLCPCICLSQYPAKPVKIVVTFTQGGAADFTARLLAEKLSASWGQQVIVENRIGAGGNIGVEAVYRAPADGQTLVLIATAHAFSAALYPNLPFDLMRDFVPLGLVTATPMAIAANPKFPAADMKALTEMLRAQPGRVSYATCGVATTQHYAMELYKFMTKTFAVHIPYRGCASAVIDTIAGQVEVVMTSLNTVTTHARAGRLRILGVTSRERSPSSPEYPTFRESGVPELKDYESDVYYGLMARAGTAPELVNKIATDTRRVMALPDVRQRFAAAGIDLFSATPEEMGALMNADIARFRKIIEYAGIRPE